MALSLSLYVRFLCGFLFLLAGGLYGQDSIHLKDGQRISGWILEEIPPISVLRIQLADSSMRVLTLDEVSLIRRGEAREGYWDRVTLKEGAEIYGFIQEYEAGKYVGMEVLGGKNILSQIDYLEIDKIEKLSIQPGTQAYQRSKQLDRSQQRAKREAKSLRYFGEYGLSFWAEFGETKFAFSTQQVLIMDLGKHYGIGMGMGLDLNPRVSSENFLAGNSFFLANRFYFPKPKVSPYLLLDPGYDFIWDGVMAHIGAGLRIPTGKGSINFNIALRVQQTDIFGNARNTLSIPDPPKVVEILQFRIVLE